MPIKLNNLSPEIQAQLFKDHPNVKKFKAPNSFNKEKVRNHSIKVLAVISDLSTSQRERVLKHALEMSAV